MKHCERTGLRSGGNYSHENEANMQADKSLLRRSFFLRSAFRSSVVFLIWVLNFVLFIWRQLHVTVSAFERVLHLSLSHRVHGFRTSLGMIHSTS